MKSQSNSQDPLIYYSEKAAKDMADFKDGSSQELDKALGLITFKVDKPQGVIEVVGLAEAKAKLLELMLSCKPEGNSMVQPDISKVPDGCRWVYFLGQNAAIDTMEQNIRGAFS